MTAGDTTNQPPSIGGDPRSRRPFTSRAALLLIPASLNLGVVAILAPAINAILARGDDPEDAIGGYAIALGIVMLVALPQMRIQQLTLVFLDDRISLGRLRRFTAVAALAAGLLAVLITVTPLRRLVLEQAFALTGDLEREARQALFALLPLSALAVVRPHLYGCALWMGHTRTVWAGTAVGVLAVVVVALALQTSGLVSGSAVGGLAVSASALVEVGLLIWLTVPGLRRALPFTGGRGPGSEYATMVRFFLPLIFAGFLATVTMPVVNAAVARTPSPETSLAAVAVAMSVNQLLVIVLWGLQPAILALLGQGDVPRRIRAFANAVGIGATVLTMVVAFVPPLTSFVLRDLVGAEGRLLEMATLGLQIFAPLPLILTQEQIYSSALMRLRRTGPILYINLIRLVVLIAFVLIALNLVHPTGVVLGIGAVAATLGVEAAASYAFGRSAFLDLSAEHALRLES
ncbi:MAG TPA: MATE family efflux transporter [Chloroflexota bacterium]|nr:MATE family efflux transporter [Chloroflexota bacterium]